VNQPSALRRDLTDRSIPLRSSGLAGPDVVAYARWRQTGQDGSALGDIAVAASCIAVTNHEQVVVAAATVDEQRAIDIIQVASK